MAKSASDILERKKAQLVERTAAALSLSTEDAVQLLSIPRMQSVRVNTLKMNTTAFEQWCQDNDVSYTGFKWCTEGYALDSLENIKTSEPAHDGSIYIQNAASWLPVIALDPQPQDRVLDVCAAPGGKTSHIAQRSNGKASITANDNSRPRLLKLQHNLQRLGVEHVEYTLHDATQLTRKLNDVRFNKILLDAPCSGEGMMTLQNNKDFASWSVAHIKRLQQLQKKLIVQAWQLLEPGGTLIYSTCTIAPEENEAVIDYLLKHNDDVELIPVPVSIDLPNRVAAVSQWNGKTYDARTADSLRLKPSEHIEAFFVCSLRKRTSSED